MSITAIIFDLGRTLADYSISEDELLEKRISLIAEFLNNKKVEADISKVREIFYERHYLPAMMKAASSLREITLPQITANALAELGGNPAWTNELLDKLFELQSRYFVVYPDSLDTLAYLASKKYRLSLLSNTSFPGAYYEEELKKAGLSSFFEEKLFSSDYGIRKPSPEIFQAMLSILKIYPDEACYIGDMLLNDIATPKSLGMMAIWIKGRTLFDFPDATPDFTISTLRDLRNIF